MKMIKKILDSGEKHFREGGRYEKYYALYEAIRTFFFIPGRVPSNLPNIRDSLDLKRFMSLVIVALMPQFLYGIYNSGYQANMVSGQGGDFISSFVSGLFIVLPLIVVSYGVGLFWEGLFAVVRKHNISEGFLVTGLLFPLTLPPTVPLWQAAVGISFGVIIGKEIFGGTGKNILNPALTARAFMFFAYPASLSGDRVWIAAKGAADAVSGATPLAVAAVTPATEKGALFLAQAGYSLKKLFLGFYPASIGETSALLCLLSAVFLCALGVASFRIILGGILGLSVTTLVINMAGGTASPLHSLGPLYQLAMGGFAFGITFMATDPVSAPGMNGARWVYGFFIGFLTMAVRAFNPAYPEGTMLAILFMNLFSPFLDLMEIKTKLRKRVPNV